MPKKSAKRKKKAVSNASKKEFSDGFALGASGMLAGQGGSMSTYDRMKSYAEALPRGYE